MISKVKIESHYTSKTQIVTQVRTVLAKEDSKDSLSKYSRADSDAEVDRGDQDNSCKNFLASVKEDFSPPIDTNLVDVLERIWGKAKLRDSQKNELKNLLIRWKCLLHENLFAKSRNIQQSKLFSLKRR